MRCPHKEKGKSGRQRRRRRCRRVAAHDAQHDVHDQCRGASEDEMRVLVLDAVVRERGAHDMAAPHTVRTCDACSLDAYRRGTNTPASPSNCIVCHSTSRTGSNKQCGHYGRMKIAPSYCATCTASDNTSPHTHARVWVRRR